MKEVSENMANKLTPETAREILRRAHAINTDFHALGSSDVDVLVESADASKYRKPANANGSRARYFHAHLSRIAARGDY
jgi:hypothetical protein